MSEKEFNDVVPSAPYIEISQFSEIPSAEVKYCEQKNGQDQLQYTHVEVIENNQDNKIDNKIKPTCSICDFVVACLYMIFIGVKAFFPILGQIHAIYILKDWKNYIEEEGEVVATLELICASYGIYLIWLIIKNIFLNIGKWIDKFYTKSWDKFIQLDDAQKKKLHKENNTIFFLFNIYESYGPFDPKEIYYNKDFDIFDHFVGLIGLTIGSFGILTIPLIYTDLYFFGNKFIEQKISSIKYFFGHIFRLIVTFGFHIFIFSFDNFNSKRLSNRILSRSLFGIMIVPYLAYCYFSYAIDWRFGYYNRIEQLKALQYQKQDKHEIRKSNEVSDELNKVFNELKSTYEVTTLEGEYFTPYTLWIFGTIMLTVGTCGLYWVYYIFTLIIDNLQLNRLEIIITIFTLGLYVIGKIWFKSIEYLQNNRHNCKNKCNKFFIEFTLFFMSFGLDYVYETICNLMCLHDSKHYKIGLMRSLIFMPFLSSQKDNAWIRVPSKITLIGYNIIVAYLIVNESPNQISSAIAIILLLVLSYPVYCAIKTITTNKQILNIYSRVKKYCVQKWRAFKYTLYYSKIVCQNSWIRTKNYVSISISNARSNTSQSLANFYNWRRKLNQSNPKFKVGKIFNPTIRNTIECKSKENFLTNYEPSVELTKNTKNLFKSALYKIKFEYNKSVKKYNIYDTFLWASRYDEFVNSANDNYVIDGLQYRVNIFVNNEINLNNQLINDILNDSQITRDDNIQKYNYLINKMNKMNKKMFDLIRDLDSVHKQTIKNKINLFFPQEIIATQITSIGETNNFIETI